MNILIITPKIPYPLTEGGKIAQYATIDYIRKKHSIILVLATYSVEDEQNVSILNKLWPEVTIEKIQMWNNLPQIKNMHLNKMQIFLSGIPGMIKYNLKKWAKKLFHKEKNQNTSISEIDSPWVVQIAVVKNRKLIKELSNIVSKHKIDIIQIDLLEYIDLGLVLPKEIKKVFVQHEIKYARLATLLKTISTVEMPFNSYVLDFVRSQEINLLRMYDGVFVFSEEDRNKLAQDLPGSMVFVTPFPVLDNFFRPIKTDLLKIEKLIFIGGEDSSPNKDAIEWYINTIGSKVRKRHNLILHVIGNWERETIEKYEDNGLVLFSGFVEDLISYCENSILVVPVRIGSGIRAKILYAMAQGVPVVSASIGCEGIGVTDKTDLLIADNPEEFVEAIHLIVTNPEMTYSMVNNAQTLIRRNYSQQVAGDLRLHYLNEIISKS